MSTTLAFDVTNPGEKLTGKAMLAFEDKLVGETLTTHAKRELLACFVVVDEKPIPRAQFDKLFDRMTLIQINQAFNQLMEALGNKAVPPATGPSSSEATAPAG